MLLSKAYLQGAWLPCASWLVSTWTLPHHDSREGHSTAGNSQSMTCVSIGTVCGRVYLTGIVDSAEEKQRAGELAGEVKGVRRVVNNIRVRSCG